jgi:glycosyltransferase involved in cell wall biosynthesis
MEPAVIRVIHFARIINPSDFIDNIISAANPNQFQMAVCVRSTTSSLSAARSGAEIPKYFVTWSSKQNIPMAVLRLAAVLRDWQPDILHTHHYEEAVIGWLATRLVPRTRLVIGRHYSNTIYRVSTGVKRSVLLRFENGANRAASRIVVPSTFISQILTQWQNVPAAKVDTIPYGFDPGKYAAIDPAAAQRIRQELGLEGHILVGTFGRLHQEKGHRFLIQAMAQLRRSTIPTTLLVLGQGPERAALEQQIADAHLGDRVRLMGWRSDAMSVMSALDMVVQPSLEEAFSQVMGESLFMGKPLIMSDVGGVADVIRNGENGLIVPPADPAALAAAIESLSADASLRLRLGCAGKKYAGEHLTIRRVVPLYEQTYLRAIHPN